MKKLITLLFIFCTVIVGLAVMCVPTTTTVKQDTGMFLGKIPANWLGWQYFTRDSDPKETASSTCAYNPVFNASAEIESTPHLTHTAEVSGPIPGADKTLILVHFFDGNVCTNCDISCLLRGAKISCTTDPGDYTECNYVYP